VREETQQGICVFCKQPITKEQRPAILLKDGEQAHMECWMKHEKEARKPN